MASEDRPAAAPMSIADVAEALAALSRMVGRLSELKALRDASLGMTEWLFLRLLAGDGSLRAGAIARRLGVSAPRATQLVKELQKAGLIDVRMASDDSRAKSLAITSRGKAQLASLDRAVLASLEPRLAARPRVLRSAAAFARGVVKDLAPRND